VILFAKLGGHMPKCGLYREKSVLKCKQDKSAALFCKTSIIKMELRIQGVSSHFKITTESELEQH
jgi:hypothetical protein